MPEHSPASHLRKAPQRGCVFLSLLLSVMGQIWHSIAPKAATTPSACAKLQGAMAPFHPFLLSSIPFLPKQSP